MQPSKETLIFEKCVLMSINLGKFGIHRKADKTKMETPADKEMVTFGKKLLDSPELKAIEQLDSQIYRYLQWNGGMRSLPFNFKDGIYLIPLSLLQEVEFKLLWFVELRDKLVKAFLKVYEKQIEDAENRLGKDHFNRNDYPSLSEMAKKFYMYWEIFILQVPETIKAVSPTIYEEEQKRIAAQMQESFKDIFKLMREETRTFMNRLIRKLTPKKDGSYPSLEEDTFGRIKDFLDSFQSRNICNDRDLGVAVEMAKQVLKGVEISDLENNDSLREEIRGEFEKASQIFNGISIKPPKAPIPTNNQVSPISEAEIAKQIEDAIDVSQQVANQNMDWADNLFDFCEVAA